MGIEAFVTGYDPASPVRFIYRDIQREIMVVETETEVPGDLIVEAK